MTMVSNAVISLAGDNQYKNSPDLPGNESAAVETMFYAPLYNRNVSVNDPPFRSLAGGNSIPAGSEISWSDWYGKSSNPYKSDPYKNPFATNNGVNNWYIAGISAGGNGPPGSPGSYSCQGQRYSMCTWLSWTRWRSNSGGGYTISNDMIIVGPNPTLTVAACQYYGLDYNNVRSLPAGGSITISLNFRVDHGLSVGYWTVTMGGTPENPMPNCNDIRNGRYTQLGWFYESGGGRQSLSNRRFTLPAPTQPNQFVMMGMNDRGQGEGSCGSGPHGWDSMTIRLV